MKKIEIYSLTLVALLATGCGSSSTSSSDPIDTTTPDILISTMIDNSLAYLSTFNGSKEANLTVNNAIEGTPSTRPYVYKNKIYVTQLMTGSTVLKIGENNGTLSQEAEMSLAPENTFAGSPIFVNETKAYLPLVMTGELAVFNPTTMTISKKIDLSTYAVGEGDTNPEPIDGVIRDGKLYLSLWQISSLFPRVCHGKTNMLIIDVATDTIEKKIEDDRTCAAGVEGSNGTIFLDEKNDIYIYNGATFSQGNPEYDAGFLRIKDGQNDFDPDYFFSIPKLDLPVEGGKAGYFYQGGIYDGNGKYYTTLSIPALVSNPPDYVNDRPMQPFILDLYNQSATKIDLPPASAWSGVMIKYKGKYLYGLDSPTGIGIYRYDPVTKKADQKPFINTKDVPIMLKNLK